MYFCLRGVVFKYMKKTFVSLVVIGLIAPQIALASWWNPFSWRVWTVILPHKTEIQEVASTTPALLEEKRVVSGSASKADETAALKKEVEDLKKQVSNIKTKETTQPVSAAVVPATTVQVSAKPTTFTLPSGAVIDDKGNVITPAPQTYYANPVIIPSTYSAPITDTPSAYEVEQARVAGLNAQVKDLQQQIIDVKTQYYKDLATLDARPGITMTYYNGYMNKLITEANRKIDLLNLQIQQLQLQY